MGSSQVIKLLQGRFNIINNLTRFKHQISDKRGQIIDFFKPQGAGKQCRSIIILNIQPVLEAGLVLSKIIITYADISVFFKIILEGSGITLTEGLQYFLHRYLIFSHGIYFFHIT